MNRPMYFMMCTALMISPCFLPRSDRRYTALPVLLGAAGLLVSILNDLAESSGLTGFIPSHEMSEAVADPGNHFEPTHVLE
jgi:hypothetical protein